MEYCCYVWDCAPNGHLDMLYKPQKQVCRTAGHAMATFLELFTCR